MSFEASNTAISVRGLAKVFVPPGRPSTFPASGITGRPTPMRMESAPVAIENGETRSPT